MKTIKTSDRVKMIREINNLTQTDFASIINLSPKTISMWENGDREITRENIKIIGDKFNVPAEFLDYGIETNLTKEQRLSFSNYFKDLEYYENFNRILENCKTKLTNDGIEIKKEFLPTLNFVNDDYCISYGIFDGNKFSNIIYKKIWNQFLAITNIKYNKPCINTDLIDDNSLYTYNNELLFKNNLFSNINNEEIKKTLILEDLVYCEDIEIFEYVIINAKKNYTNEEFKTHLNYLLKNLSPKLNNFYKIIVFLIDNGAFYETNDINQEKDVAKTNFIYRLSKDMIKIKSKE